MDTLLLGTVDLLVTKQERGAARGEAGEKSFPNHSVHPESLRSIFFVALDNVGNSQSVLLLSRGEDHQLP